ncbi:MAG TPA: dihydrolipoamide acetyltransferase family protein, partial [Acidobacteriota bacterium]|nr:dihydrolipoamide acetyltransferase family protein [Acidobacteriota bacterium]
MVHPIIMPKLGQMTEESTIVRWLKREGDPVGKGDILFEIETDKAVMEVESFFDGTLLKIVVPENQTVPVMTTVAFVGNPGEPIPTVAPLPSAPSRPSDTPLPPRPAPQVSPPVSRTVAPAAVPPPAVAKTETQVSSAPAPAKPGRLRISPRARRLAVEKGIHLTGVQGTGPGGRIIERDVRTYLSERGYDRLRVTPAARALATAENLDLLEIRSLTGDDRIDVEDVRLALAERPRPLDRMRQVIAERLTRSFTTTPHFFVTVSADVTELSELRQRLKQHGQSYTLSDFIVKACALALCEFPEVNSTTDGKNVQWHSRIHIGLAVSLDRGLVVPVIRDAQDLSLPDIHQMATE